MTAIDDNVFTINLNNKPNLMKLRLMNQDMYREVVGTCVALAEEAANPDLEIPWYDLPGKINDDLSFKTLMPAIVRAFFNVKGINPEDFDFLGMDVHPMAVFRKADGKLPTTYPNWRRHFDLPEDTELDEKAIVSALRKLYYYARFISIDGYSDAFMNNRSVLYKDDVQVALETLPYVPAIRYQKEHLPDFTAGKFWEDIGALKGGTVKPEEIESGECLACKVGTLQEIHGYHVCTHCNIGFKVE